MVPLLVFAVTLYLAVMISGVAERSVLSTAVLFLFASFVAGSGMLNFITAKADHPVVAMLAELALFSVLFTDGMRVGVGDLVRAWHLSGRALLFKLPLTLVIIATFGYWLAGLSWAEALLVGAVLSPTDPVFASAIVGRYDHAKHTPGSIMKLLEDLDVVVGSLKGEPEDTHGEGGFLAAVEGLNGYLRASTGLPIDLRTWLPLGFAAAGLWSIARQGLMI